MKILLHICCAPCSIHPYKELELDKQNSLGGFFYNPNIHPYAEYKHRKTALEEYSKKIGLRVIFHKYDAERFFKHVSGNEKFGARCAICWRLRLEETADYAKLNGFGAFTTTLLVSPYQDQDRLREIGMDISKKSGVDFLYKDFRPGFKSCQDEAKRLEIYRQKYCGCVFSEKERYEKQTKDQRLKV